MRFAKYSGMMLALFGLIGLAVVAGDTKPETKTDAKKAAAKTPAKPAPKEAARPAPEPAKPADPAEIAAAIAKEAEDFVKAYNARDAKAIAAEFTTEGEFVTESGLVIKGREAIEKHFADLFEEYPQARVKLAIDEVRLITPSLAVEEGFVEACPAEGSPFEISQYVALHVRQGDKWLLARTSDYPGEMALPSSHQRLLPLGWLVGEWIDESPDALVMTTCKWADNENYLLQEFAARIGGEVAVSGSTRIGWDPLAKQIKSWTFDSEGGYSEALWTQVDDKWVLKSRGVTSDGEISSATNTITLVDESTMTWQSRDRMEGGETSPNVPPIVVKRLPPAPGK